MRPLGLEASLVFHREADAIANIESKRVYDTYEDGHNRRSNSAHIANAIQVSLVTGYSS